MLPRDAETMQRLQELVASLIEKRIAQSLSEVQSAMSRWQSGSLSALGAHGAILRHAARCDRTVERVTAAAADRPEGLLRDAVDAGILDAEEFTKLVGAAPAEVAPADSLKDDGPVTPNKKAVTEQLLEEGPILVHLDPRRDGVSVPARFATEPTLRLRFGYGLTPAILDLEVNDAGVAGTLSFGGVPHRCVLPWSAIFAVQLDGDSKGQVWSDDVPDEMLVPASDGGEVDDAPPPVPSPTTEEPKKRGGHLRLVD